MHHLLRRPGSPFLVSISLSGALVHHESFSAQIKICLAKQPLSKFIPP